MKKIIILLLVSGCVQANLLTDAQDEAIPYLARTVTVSTTMPADSMFIALGNACRELNIPFQIKKEEQQLFVDKADIGQGTLLRATISILPGKAIGNAQYLPAIQGGAVTNGYRFDWQTCYYSYGRPKLAMQNLIKIMSNIRGDIGFIK